MYEVYNDRIFDLLSGNTAKNKQPNVKRRALLFKNTEKSPDRKVVAGLTKIICGSFEEAMMVLETGLMERKVTGTGSNAVSSRSHGFFHVEIKKRAAERKGPWSSSNLTIVDLAGSERARNAKTAGETLAEAGKINESLMYLGQCMQMQSDNQGGSKVHICIHVCNSSTNMRLEHCAIPSMQAYRTAFLKLIPCLCPPSTIAPPASEVHHGRNCRPQRRLQRHISDPSLLSPGS
jgi:succinate--hydroxymethylglutarate CoA-transferase